MEFQAPVLLLAVITGVTELIKRARARDWWVVTTIATAAVIGMLFGVVDYFPGVDPVEGLVYGFAACGALTAISSFSNKTTARPSEPVR